MRLILILLGSGVTFVGCADLALWTATMAAGGTVHAISGEPGPDPPSIVHSTPDSVTVWYDRKALSEQLHGEAERLIQEHCGGPFESRRTELDGSFVIEATCN